MAFSPYTPGSVATAVPGRASMLAEYREAAQRIAQLGQFVPRVHVVHGPRGIGKTSLLRQGQRVFEATHIRTVWLTAAVGEILLHSLLAALAQLVGTGTKMRRRAVERIESISVELGNAVVGKLSATVRANDPAFQASSSARLIDAMAIALDAIEADGDAGLAILVDEIQEADEASLRTIAYAWQEMAHPGRRISAALFAVGLPGAPAHINKAVSFSERYHFDQLHALDEEGASEALTGPAGPLGVSWEADALARAIAEAEGYPHKIQLVGDSSWREGSVRVGSAGLEPGHSVTLADVRAGLPRVGTQMEALHRSRWGNASPKQRDVLIAIARLGGHDVRRGALAALLGAETRSISVPRQALLDKGIVDASGHGSLSFTVPGFTEFVLARAADD